MGKGGNYRPAAGELTWSPEKPGDKRKEKAGTQSEQTETKAPGSGELSRGLLETQAERNVPQFLKVMYLFQQYALIDKVYLQRNPELTSRMARTLRSDSGAWTRLFRP